MFGAQSVRLAAVRACQTKSGIYLPELELRLLCRDVLMIAVATTAAASKLTPKSLPQTPNPKAQCGNSISSSPSIPQDLVPTLRKMLST